MNIYLEVYPVVIEFPVAWGEMDALQHVSNVVYFRYFESARVEYFNKIDLFGFMEETGIGVILASTQCHYKAPLMYPDRVSVGTKVADMGQDRFWMGYRIVSQNQKKIVAEGDCVMVSFDYRNNQKVPIPVALKRRIRAVEGTKANGISY